MYYLAKDMILTDDYMEYLKKYEYEDHEFKNAFQKRYSFDNFIYVPKDGNWEEVGTGKYFYANLRTNDNDKTKFGLYVNEPSGYYSTTEIVYPLPDLNELPHSENILDLLDMLPQSYGDVLIFLKDGDFYRWYIGDPKEDFDLSCKILEEKDCIRKAYEEGGIMQILIKSVDSFTNSVYYVSVY